MMNKITIDLADAVDVADIGVKISAVLESSQTVDNELYLKLGNIDLKQSQLLGIKALIEVMQSTIGGIETTSEMTEASAVGLGLYVGRSDFDNAPVFDKNYEPNVSKSFEEEFTSSEEISSFAQLKGVNPPNDEAHNVSDFEGEEVRNMEADKEQFFNAQQDNTQEMTKEERVANIEDSLEKEMTHEDIQDALDITFGPTLPSNNQDQQETVEEPKEEVIAEKNNDEELPSEDIFAHIKLEEQLQDREITETVERTDETKYILLDTEGITPEGIELIKANTSDLDTLYLTQTLRSGQTVSYEGNIFLIGDAHPGSEINATGDVTVWGILGGIVHAGTKGNTDAKVRALKLNPIQLRIANLYSRRNDTVNVPYVQKSNEFTPEEARIENEQIVIYKTLRRED